jgi:hypothetical protein
LTFRLVSPLTISTARSQAAFRPVTAADYPQNELRRRPERVRVGPPYGYPPPPYWGYYGWGPYVPYFSFGYFPRWGYYRGWGYRR